MFGKSVRIVIAFFVIIELCHCMVSRSSPLRRSLLPNGVPFTGLHIRIPQAEPQAEPLADPIAEPQAEPQSRIIPFASRMSIDENTARGIDEKYAEIGDFSHQVLLLDIYNNYVCAGALISDRWSLSAAACSNRSPAKIVVGGFTLRDGDVYFCDKIITHDQFDQSTLANDIALFRSNREIQLNQFAQPIPFIKSPNLSACAENLVAIGWGHNPGYMSQERYLGYANMSAIENDICQVHSQNLGSPLTIFPSSVCAVGNVKEMGLLCNEGTGAPLSFSGSRVLIGIYSSGTCGFDTQFAFTGVSNYADWIAQNANVIGVDSI